MNGALRDEAPGAPAGLEPAQLTALIRGASDEQLAQALAANREWILSEAFRRMPERLRTEKAQSIDAVIEWVIQDRSGHQDRFQLRLAAGVATVQREKSGEPDLTLALGGVEFLKLIAGAVSGPQLFLFGKLRLRGNLVLAARLPSLFSIPGLDEQKPS